MKLATWKPLILTASLTAGCLPFPADGALFSDISKAPPAAQPSTIEAIKHDRPFGEWVIYQARACAEWGCAQ